MVATNGQTRRCGGCDGTDLRLLFSLGAMPPVNAFLAERTPEARYPLDLYFCPACTLVQLGKCVPPEALFSSYLHLSSASQSNLRHLQEVAEIVKGLCHQGRESSILEIGSNDGSFLGMLVDWAGEVLGVDPARNLVPAAESRGVPTICRFFSEELGDEIAHARGSFDIVVALNVVAHTPDFVSLLRGVRHLLAPQGAFLLEVAYVVETILHGQFDTIYHEHVYCFSLHALKAAFQRAGLTIFDAQIIPSQGSSLRLLACRDDARIQPRGSVAAILRGEQQKGFTKLSTYLAVGPRLESFRATLKNRLTRLNQRHGRVAGLGAPARGVVILNYCQLDKDCVQFVIDDTPLKQGRLVPGQHIPVCGWEVLSQLGSQAPQAFLLLSWNYRREVLEKLKHYCHAGTILIPFPEICEVDLATAPSQ